MSKSITFSMFFNTSVTPASLLHKAIGQDDFSRTFLPKVIHSIADQETWETDPGFLNQVKRDASLVKGERTIAQGVTSFTQRSDMTPDLDRFLTRAGSPSQFYATLLGDWRIDYHTGTDLVEAWLFRFGNAVWRYPIVWCRVNTEPFGGASLLLVIHCPWFFLKNWWPDGVDIPRYATSDTAERNWKRLVEFVRFLVNVEGIDKLESTNLDLEGSPVSREKDWLLHYAQQIPKLEVSLT